MRKFDLIVIGGGSGLNVASHAARKGLSVALIEPGPLGGTCLNRGCIPSKILIETAEVAQTIKRAGAFNIQAEIQGVDFPAIIARTMDFVDEEAAGIEEAVKANPKYTLYKKFAHFTGPKKLMVGDEEIEGEKIVIAAGSRPAIPPIPGLDQTAFHSSDTIFRLLKLPPRIVFIGGGYISCEMASFFGSLGSEITVIDRGELLVSNEDEEIAAKFTEVFSRRYRVIKQAAVKQVSGPTSGKEGEVAVTVEVSGRTQEIKADVLFVAAGRVPNTDNLECAKAGFELTEKGYLVVNEYLETSVPGVWALGDIVGKAPFKHGANWEAKHVVLNTLGDKKTAVDYRVMPHAIYSSPQVAGVGMREQDLKEKKIEYTVGKYPYIKTGMGKALQDEDGFVKILADPKTRKILGAHILGTDASILIHELVVALAAAGGNMDAIKNSIHIHPSLSEVIQRAVNAVNLEGPATESGKTLMERTSNQTV
ncbi:dihydrolipoyl dehydrogenase [candidate division WWE3 bacterium RBG_19FT_COMBO_53_11]|uniref:Dihydrolipoyl dehydrogenase n=1 Tax=candidate division WWE3 bacterium RBG_19FT_COMBO_53_11 TaxID=1802613 RepID=A0A1F4UKV3_UNCKA|nr:MAG: dihydrolipoyl dehydrogenase [candidate division WWE3 bacterium RBG_16_52_45]OGC44853.1 MAG: dihydrolipoyl dehydrogenase [candidate division WWE3 bacterium RBG_19FT_COMBO_53_11]